MTKSVGGFCGYQTILFDDTNHVYYGASESKNDGQTAGYQVIASDIIKTSRVSHV